MKAERQDVIDLGNPTQMVGHSAFSKHAGGGRCADCRQMVASLMPDEKCARCSTQSFFGPPMPGSQDPEDQRRT